MLQEMFDKQKALQSRLFGVTLPALMPERIPMAVTSIIAELGEILEEQQAWKDWKKHPKPVDYENLDTEIADVWHFVINFTLYSGHDAAVIHYSLPKLFEAKCYKPRMNPEGLPPIIKDFVVVLGNAIEAPTMGRIMSLWDYLVKLTGCLGYDADMTYRAFIKKNATNHVRQDNNY